MNYDEKAEPAEQLLEQFYQCAALFQRGRHLFMHERMLEGMNKHSQARLLGILLKDDGLPQKEIVEIMDIRPSSVGELVGKLEQSGLAERRENEHDKRVTNVFLTEAGRAAAQKAETMRANVDLFIGLDAEEQTQLSQLMGKLIASLKTRFVQRDLEWPEGRPGRPCGARPPFGVHADPRDHFAGWGAWQAVPVHQGARPSAEPESDRENT